MDRVGDRDMGSFLLSAFKNRYQEVLAKAHSAAFAAASKFLTLLTKEETNCEIHTNTYFTILSIVVFHKTRWIGICVTILHIFLVYEAAQSSMAAFKKWRIGGPRFQRAAVLGRKRKPAD